MERERLTLEALLGLRTFRPEERVTIDRGDVVFGFTLRALSEREMVTCRERCTRRTERGAKLDESAYHSALIYAATAEEDRQTLWDARGAWREFGALTGEDMVDALLLAGEKKRALNAIARLSGYANEGLEKEIKN